MERLRVDLKLRCKLERRLRGVAKLIGQAQPRGGRNRFGYPMPKDKPSQCKGRRYFCRGQADIEHCGDLPVCVAQACRKSSTKLTDAVAYARLACGANSLMPSFL